MTPEQRFTENKGLIYFTIKKYFGGKDRVIWSAHMHGMDWEDIEQIGWEGLWIACTKFDESRGVKFVSYAINYIRQHIKHQIRTTGYKMKFPHKMTFAERNDVEKLIKSTELVMADDGSAVRLIDLIPDDENWTSESIGNILAHQLTELMSANEKQVFLLKMKGFDSVYISKMTDRKSSTVNSFYSRALEKARKAV